MLLGAQLLLLLLLLKWKLSKLFGASGYEGVLFGKDACDAGGDFVMNDRLVVFSNEIDSKFLLQM